MQKLTKLGAWNFWIGFMYIFLGIIAFLIFALRIRKSEGFIFYLGLLNITYGLKFLNNNPLFQFSELSLSSFWVYGMPIVSLIFPIAFILFIRYFIGWGWKKSILWLLIYSLLQGVLRIISDYSHPARDIYGTTNTIFGYLAIVVLFLHLFLPKMRKNQEVQIISFGLGLYLLAIFYDNMAVVPIHISFQHPAYMIFNICLIYVAFRRITSTEKAYLAVKQDLETARTIQNAILPETNPKGKGFEVSSAYLPMALIGGDYYDYQLSNKSIGLLIADVSGHGISAALIASMLKVAFASQINNSRNPAVVLQQINQSLNGQLNNEFITAGYMAIDLENRELTYSSAGHPPMLVYRRNNNEISEINVGGIPIGVNPEATYIETKIQLFVGDRLILYTDGVTDVFNLSGEAMGKTRFIDLIKESKNLIADDTIESILTGINRWTGKKEFESHDDDITLIVFDIV
jgi:phosphoserine phosphatase RsbU/P